MAATQTKFCSVSLSERIPLAELAHSIIKYVVKTKRRHIRTADVSEADLYGFSWTFLDIYQNYKPSSYFFHYNKFSSVVHVIVFKIISKERNAPLFCLLAPRTDPRAHEDGRRKSKRRPYLFENTVKESDRNVMKSPVLGIWISYNRRLMKDRDDKLYAATGTLKIQHSPFIMPSKNLLFIHFDREISFLRGIFGWLWMRLSLDSVTVLVVGGSNLRPFLRNYQPKIVTTQHSSTLILSILIRLSALSHISYRSLERKNKI